MKILEGEVLAREVKDMLHRHGQLSCAVAFWGPRVAAIAAARGARVVLDISMGGTSRNALRALGVPNNPKVRVLDGLHAKLYVGADRAVIASANASENAIGSDLGGPLLREAGVLISKDAEPAAFAAAQRLFRLYWREGRVAGPADLARAPKAPLVVPGRDRLQNPRLIGSVLDGLLASPERFSSTGFIFGDQRLTKKERLRADTAYAEENDGSAGPKRELICATFDKTEASALGGGAYLIMYWFGSRPGIYAYHDLVRVKAGRRLTAFYGRRQWSTVRCRIGFPGLIKVAGVWDADRVRAARLSKSQGAVPGDRFVVMRHDEVYEALEAGL